MRQVTSNAIENKNLYEMKTKTIFQLALIFFPMVIAAQTNDAVKTWTLEECITYALNENIQVRKSDLSNQSYQVYSEQATNQKLPSVNASVRQNFGWGNQQDMATGESSFKGNNSTNYSVNSSVTVYSGLKLNYRIKQALLNIESGKYNSETIKESVTLNVLNGFLQVLFAEEQVKNAEKQIESTTEQLNLAGERLNLSIISRSDYLQVKSQLASEKLSMANAQSQLSIAKVNLMQLMELQVSSDFFVSHPNMEELLNQNVSPNPQEVYSLALGIKPQIKNAAIQKESAVLDEKISAADYYPTLSLDGGLGTGYSSLSTGMNYFDQLDNQISPSVGLSLSIPIFQKKQVKTNISLAKIGIKDAELNEIDTKNQLRKEIEQACVDVTSAQIEFEASLEKFSATDESYELANEKFNQGLINSVDFLFEKTNLIVAESQLLQSKYNLIFSYKILDFYSGVPIQL